MHRNLQYIVATQKLLSLHHPYAQVGTRALDICYYTQGSINCTVKHHTGCKNNPGFLVFLQERFVSFLMKFRQLSCTKLLPNTKRLTKKQIYLLILTKGARAKLAAKRLTKSRTQIYLLSLTKGALSMQQNLSCMSTVFCYLSTE